MANENNAQAQQYQKYDLLKIYTYVIIGISALTIIIQIFAAFTLYPNVETSEDKLIVDNLNCKIPFTATTAIKHLKIKRTKLPPCKLLDFLTIIESTDRPEDIPVVKYKKKLLGRYNVTDINNVVCCYHIIKRVRNSDSNITISKECIEFNEERTPLSHDIKHIYVKCKSPKDGIFYENVQAIISSNLKIINRQRRSGIRKKNPYSVLMLGIDGMSRMNFQRGSPKCFSYMNGSDYWFDLKGYTPIGTSSFPNLFAILTGQSPSEAQENCDPTTKSFLDGCPFIWKNYQSFGYVTAYGEDQCDRNTFNKNHKGFNQQPTDHYLRPYVLTAQNYMKFHNKNDLTYCLANSLYIDHIFVYAQKVFQIYVHEPYFGVFYVNSLVDKHLSSSPWLDARIANSFLNKLENDEFSKNLIVIYFGDVGARFEQNMGGFYEERSPLLSIRLPKKFQRDYPDIVESLKINSNRLTTPYDLHVTLKHILNLSADEKVPEKAIGCRSCQSLFEEVSPGRSCRDVNIPDHLCPCSLVEIDPSKKVLKHVVRFAIKNLNYELSKMKTTSGKNCTKLKVDRITLAYQQLISSWTMNYIIRFTVLPSNDEFEAIMRKKFISIIKAEPQFELIKEIIRINNDTRPNICVDPDATSNRRINEEYEDDYEIPTMI
ncbi:CLUMA_CG013134, isoform A [Clunio marinus]|uniref:CLUMA_CG013134, isoform A n=1 Tax=Clunio marinus TaxID=568069 RepID=A0A1J1IJ84_9DIPT|nr:CLUMA_CG013134, isoform A [Clunio marinus]